MLYLVPSFILAALLVWREVRHDRQVQSLLDRIQAPQQVLAQRAPEPSGEMLYVPMDDDEAFEAFEQDRAAGIVS